MAAKMYIYFNSSMISSRSVERPFFSVIICVISKNQEHKPSSQLKDRSSHLIKQPLKNKKKNLLYRTKLQKNVLYETQVQCFREALPPKKK